MAKREFTAIYTKKGAKYLGWVEELPGVNTQGKTKKETRDNLKEALFLILEANRKLAARQKTGIIFREQIRVPIPA